MPDAQQAVVSNRREAVLRSALMTFARFGYRKTSMDEIARAAQISRPGLYFLFASKEELFRSAVEQALNDDLKNVEATLGETERQLSERLVDAFDVWAGPYIGPIARGTAAVIDENPELLGGLVVEPPRRFARLVTDAIATATRSSSALDVAAVTQTLISVSIGIKYQVERRSDYRARITVAVDLLLGHAA